MKNTTPTFYFTFLLLFIFSACNNSNDDLEIIFTDEGVVVIQEIEEEDEEEEIEDVLEFSDPPFDISETNALFAEHISYGEHNKNIFDIFIPESETPTSLVILIHGGGFLGGNKTFFYQYQDPEGWNFPEEIRSLLNQNIAVVSINYRVLEQVDSEGIIKPLSDSKRCLQFIRKFAALLNIDKDKIALYGVSAGAGTSLWLNFHEDMADANNEDEVLQESTRVLGVACLETQATYDLKRWASDIFTIYDITFEELLLLDEQRVLSFYGISNVEEIDSEEIIAYRANVDMLALMSEEDPSFWASNIIRPVNFPNSIGLVTHHAFHVEALKNRANEVGVSNISYYGNPIIYGDSSEETSIEYLVRILSE